MVFSIRVKVGDLESSGMVKFAVSSKRLPIRCYSRPVISPSLPLEKPYFSVSVVSETAAKSAFWFSCITKTMPKLIFSYEPHLNCSYIPWRQTRSQLINANSLCSTSPWTRHQADRGLATYPGNPLVPWFGYI